MAIAVDPLVGQIEEEILASDPVVSIAASPTESSPRFEAWADLARALSIFLLFFSISFAGYSRTLPPPADEMINFSLTQSLAKWGIISIDQVSTVGPNPEEFGADDHRYSKYGPLQAILSVPLFWLAQRLPIGTVDTVLLLNHLIGALTAAVFYILARRLGYRPRVVLGLTVLMFFGTPLWVQAKRYLSEPTITLGIVVTLLTAYLATTTRRAGWLIATGLCFGLTVAAKYINAVLLIPVPLYLAWELGRRRGGATARGLEQRGGQSSGTHALDGLGGIDPAAEGVAEGRAIGSAIRALALFAGGAAPIAVLLLAYNLARFGRPLETGYASWEGFSTPVWVGVAGFLFSPGKSIFVYTPALLFLPFWAPRFVRRFPPFSALVLAIIGLHLALFGSWWVWWGAWTWGARFIVPILPLLALLLAEGVATLRGWATRAALALLATLSIAIQMLGIAVDHAVYIMQLLPLNSKPDTLTLYDLRYSPILHQIPLLRREWLDFAWIVRAGPDPIDPPALTAVLIGVIATSVAILIVWRTSGWTLRTAVLGLALVAVAGGTYQALRDYARQTDPAITSIAAAIERAPADTALIQMIPKAVIPYANAQKRALPEIGWIEEPRPQPIMVRRIDRLAASHSWIWVLTEAPPKAPSSGIEARLDRTLVPVGEDAIGPFRLLRFATDPARLSFVPQSAHFTEGIDLTGFAVRGAARAGHTVDVILEWRADPGVTERGDYTVFAHLVTDARVMIAQHDDPPARGFAPTNTWQPGQVIYDLHSIAVPADAPEGLHLVQIGLYRPTDGARLPLRPDGGAPGDTVTLDLSQASPIREQ